MNEILNQVLSQLVFAACGAIGTGIVFVAKSLMRAKKDLDAAHEKIREIEEKLQNWKV